VARHREERAVFASDDAIATWTKRRLLHFVRCDITGKRNISGDRTV
jgi:hypothetical protein